MVSDFFAFRPFAICLALSLSLPLFAIFPFFPKADAAVEAVIEADKVLIYRKPTRRSKALVRLFKGKKVVVSEKILKGYRKIRVKKGLMGWIRNSQIKVIGKKKERIRALEGISRTRELERKKRIEDSRGASLPPSLTLGVFYHGVSDPSLDSVLASNDVSYFLGLNFSYGFSLGSSFRVDMGLDYAIQSYESATPSGGSIVSSLKGLTPSLGLLYVFGNPGSVDPPGWILGFGGRVGYSLYSFTNESEFGTLEAEGTGIELLTPMIVIFKNFNRTFALKLTLAWRLSLMNEVENTSLGTTTPVDFSGPALGFGFHFWI